MPLRDVVSGPWGRIREFVRANGRCPARDFLQDMDHKLKKKFRGSFDQVTKFQEYQNPQRFKPLIGNGKPLWEFKEHDHRLYCTRNLDEKKVADVVLLNGWAKDKEGKTEREAREIARAQDLYQELRTEVPGGKL